MNIGTLQVKSTKTLLNPNARIAALVYCPAKRGKTVFASSLNDLTLKYRGKKTLIIACEVAEGGGTMSLNTKDVDYVTPSNWTEMEQVLAGLTTNETYGGVVLDNVTDYVIRIVKPYALRFPSKEHAVGARENGVPVRSDYQVMGECARQQLNKLLNLSNESTPEKFRKDVVVTALEREKSDEKGNVTAITPDLPGALANVVTAMFQSVLSIGIKQKIVPDPANPKLTKRISTRYLHVANDGLKVTDDRMGIFQHEYSLTNDDGTPRGLLEIYEAFLERIKGAA